MIQKLKAAPRFTRRGSVDKREQNTSDNWQHGQDGRAAAENVKPACARGWRRVIHALHHEALKSEPPLKPCESSANRRIVGFAHEGNPGLPVTSRVGAAD